MSICWCGEGNGGYVSTKRCNYDERNTTKGGYFVAVTGEANTLNKLHYIFFGVKCPPLLSS